MSTFYDRWLAAVATGAVRGYTKTGLVPLAKKESLAEDLRGIQVIKAQTVYEWACDLREGGTDYTEQIVCATPPFRKAWVEFVHQRVNQIKPLNVGCWVLSEQFADGAGGMLAQVMIENDANGWRYLGRQVIKYDANGKPDASVTGYREYPGDRDHYPAAEYDQVIGVLTLGAAIACLAFQLMNCPEENVPRELVTPPAGLSKKWRKKHGRELVKYYTLDVGPDANERKKAQQLLDDAKREGRQPPRLHWVRGHFKRGQYVTPERPQGRYCRPFLRGSSASGIVVKDYNVRAPMESTPARQQSA